ncbi:hypothetical protein [Fimbriiglobus ruber]|uniref:hypothetical protein n=1 Tax=Fimbriiglobus ruber TaxID=1908690 RepID=UPI00117A49B9|nr:hypothetical protein [Fimbriiglobus ruber]
MHVSREERVDDSDALARVNRPYHLRLPQRGEADVLARFQSVGGGDRGNRNVDSVTTAVTVRYHRSQLRAFHFFPQGDRFWARNFLA